MYAKCACVANACIEHTHTIRENDLCCVCVCVLTDNIIMIHVDRVFMHTRHENHKDLTKSTYKHIIILASSVINH